MAAMIQIRNVPDGLHRRLKARAALAGMSLSDYLLDHLRELGERPGQPFSRSSIHDAGTGRPRGAR
jgi:plasmid stability protein